MEKGKNFSIKLFSASCLISEVDTLYSFAMVALADPACPYVMPKVNETGDLILK